MDEAADETGTSHHQSDHTLNQTGHDSSNEEDDEFDYSEAIDRNHLEIVTNLDLDRQFLISYLRSNSVFDEEDCEIIRNTGVTRQQKVSIFLDTIKRKGKHGMKHFIDALEYDHPMLYEKVTGKKAIPVSPPVPHCFNGTWNWTTGLAGKEYIDFDRTILAKQLEQTVSDLHWITRSLHKVQEEKNILENKNMESQTKIQMQEQHISELKEVIEKTAKIKRLSDEEKDEGRESFELTQHYQMVTQHEIVQKANLIILLQGKLLAQTEEVENIRQENQKYKEQLDSLNKEIYDLALICDKERRNSKRLNEHFMSHHGEIQQIDRYKKRNRELKFQIEIVMGEKADLQAELAEFRKYSEVLNAKYNIMSEEKTKLHERRKEMTSSFKSVQEQLNELSIKHSGLKCENEYLQRTNERLLHDVKTYRELQKTLQEEHERLRTECDESWKSLEKANEDVLKAKRNQDEAIHCQFLINSALDSKYRDVSEELDDLRICLQQTKEELVCTKKMLGVSRSSGSFSEIQLLPAIQDATNQAAAPEVEEAKVIEEKCENSQDPAKSDDEAHVHGWKRRGNKEILDSIKRKVSGEENHNLNINESKASTFPKGVMTYDQMLMMHKSYSPVSKSLPRQINNQLLLIPSRQSISSSTGGSPLSPTSPFFYPASDPSSSPEPGTGTGAAKTLEGSKNPSEVSVNCGSSGVASNLRQYSRPISFDPSMSRKDFKDQGSNSSFDSVFEYNAKRLSDCPAPSSLHSTKLRTSLTPPNKRKGKDKKNSWDKEDVKPKEFRARSFLVDTLEHERKRSASEPLISSTYQL